MDANPLEEPALATVERAAARVLAAVDGSETATRACRFAVRILGGAGLDVRVLTVLSFELDPYTLLGEATPETAERLAVVDRAVLEATEEPRKIFEQAGHHVSVFHRFGNPADEILADIEDWEPTLVVLGRRGLAAPSRWLLGSVSERVLRHTYVPVLVAP